MLFVGWSQENSDILNREEQTVIIRLDETFNTRLLNSDTALAVVSCCKVISVLSNILAGGGVTMLWLSDLEFTLLSL